MITHLAALRPSRLGRGEGELTGLRELLGYTETTAAMVQGQSTGGESAQRENLPIQGGAPLSTRR